MRVSEGKAAAAVKAVVMALICMVAFVIAALPADAIIDYPHFEINNIGCDSCHFIYGTEPSLLPLWTSHVPQNIDDTQYNTLCWSCHNDIDAPYMKTHSSLQTDDGYGNWTVECRVCHNPHYQKQFRTYGSASYLYSGVSTSVTTNTITKTGAEWTDDAYQGLVVVPNVSQKNYNYKILSNTSETLTVQGQINLTKAAAGNTFAIVYGKLVYETIDLSRITTDPSKSGSKTVRFFNSTGSNSFADGNLSYDGICEVCHTLTTHFRNDGTGSNQQHTNVGTPAGTDCTTCHSHENGFAHGGGSGTGCGDATSCHGVQKSHPMHVGGTGIQLSLACSDCHDTNNFPLFKDGQNLANTTACNACHSPEGTYDGVNDPAVGAKNNFTAGVYNGSALKAGKEKWCATCHDESLSVISGVSAPNIAGDEDGPFNYGTGYGYYKTGHGLSTTAAFPSSGGVAKGPGLQCDACHDYSLSHIDGNARTYDASVSDGGNLYRTGFRLKQVDLGDGLINPMYLPWPDSSVNKERFALCAKCHDPQPFLGQNNDTNMVSNGSNEHAHHLANASGMNARYDSDWGGSNESRINCTACHNVHGSQRLAMMRDGSLVNRTPGFEVWYDNPAFVSDNSGDATPPVPQNLTLIKSTGLIMLETSTNGRMCSACHNRTFTTHYTRSTLRWKGNTPALDWTGETNYETRGIHTDRLFNTAEDVRFRVMYFDPDNDAPSSIQVWVDKDDDETYEDNADPGLDEKIDMVEDDPFDTTYTNGKIYKVTVTLTNPGGDRKIKYRVYASDGTNDAVGQPAQDQIIEWDADFIRSVPGEYTTLQDAISIAYDGNTILVSNGTYNENINYGGKDLIIQSLNGAAVTSITGSGSNNPVVTFSGGETSAAVLDGFTINNVDNSSNYNMNGIKISNGSTPTIKNSIITGNNMRGKGAGILIDGGAATIENCTIDSNISSFETGAGLHLENGTATTTITNSSISSNTSKTSGGGLYVANSTIELTNVTMNSNRINESSGGGAYFTGNVNATISGGSISSNASKYSGAGLCYSGSGAGSLSISDVTINSNTNNTTSTSNGGGLYLENIGSTTTITNTTINSNIAKSNGGGMYLNNAPVILTGCTISSNSVNDSSGGGVWSNSSMTINSSVISSNVVNHSPDRGGGLNLSGATSIVNISGTTINGNRAPGSAGIHFTGLELNIVGGSISGNTGTAQIDGGGLYAGSGTVSLYGTYVQGNWSGHGGGGVYVAGSLTITNCVVTGNVCGGNYWARGGGIIAGGINMMNTTVAGNTCQWAGGVNAGGTVKNSISLNNESYRDGNDNFDGNPTVSYTDTAGGGYTNGGNNISVDPLFVNQRPYAESPTTAGDYHLKNASPVKGQATPTGAPADDIDGDARPQEGSYDMGADEYIPVIPATPTIGTAFALSTASIRWYFTDTADNETGFKVHDSSHTVMASSATPGLTYLDETGLSPNTQYTRHVHAYNVVGDSTGSSDASKYTLAEPPTSPAATDGTYEDKINVSWTASASASHYHVYRDSVSGVGTLVHNSTGTSFDDTITEGHTYYIYSVNGDDDNSASYISDYGFSSGDPNPPSASNLNPANSATDIDLDSNLTLTLSDSWSGVDWSAFDITLTGSNGYSKHYTDLDTAMVTKTGTSASFNVTINPDTDFSINELITATVTVSDLAGNAMSAPAWSFSTTLFPPGTYTVCKTGHADAPCDYQAIQTAINAVSNGNTVLVSADTYSENINYNGKNITVMSRAGAVSTTIQGASGTNIPVVRFVSGEGATAVLKGFTINNQYTLSDTRGVKIENSSKPTIENCVIKGNDTGSSPGGGIYIYFASATIRNTTIGGDASAKNNGNDGGGIYARLTDTLTIDGCIISENTASSQGGGINLYSNGTTQTNITNTTFTNNSAVNGGGAILDNSSKLSIADSTFSGNTTTNGGSNGGAINFYNSLASVSATISNTNFTNNTAVYRGGAIYVSTATNNTPVTISGGSFTGNSNTNMGGAIYMTGGTTQATIENAMITGNSSYLGGGIAISSVPSTITNSVVNTNTVTGSGGGIYVGGGSATMTITGGTVNGNYASFGGGIVVDNGMTLNVTGATVNGNSTTNNLGGGIAVAGSSTLNLTKTAVKGNTSGSHGGGISNYPGTTTLRNCTVSGNTAAAAGSQGGGLYNRGTLNIYSTTIAGNYAGQYGGGLMRDAGGTTIATNSILWDNTAGSSGNEIFGTTTTVTYSDVEGGYTGTGNLNSDPLFVLSDPAGAGAPKTTGDYHIQSGSPVINQGTATGAPADDMDGDSRPQGSGIDMGADEKE